MISEPRIEPLKEIKEAAFWWTNHFRTLLKEHERDAETASGVKLSLIPGLVGAALAERERLEQHANETSKAKRDGVQHLPRSKLEQRVDYRGTSTLTQALENFECYLVEELMEKYRGHWYPNCRARGHAYRCIKVDPASFFDSSPGTVDSVLLRAASRAMITSMICKALSPDDNKRRQSIYMFVNPGEVKLVRTTFGFGGISHDTKHIFKSPAFSLTKQEPLFEVEKKSSRLYPQHSSTNRVYARSKIPSFNGFQKSLPLQCSSGFDDTRSNSPSSCATSSACSGPVLLSSSDLRPKSFTQSQPLNPCYTDVISDLSHYKANPSKIIKVPMVTNNAPPGFF